MGLDAYQQGRRHGANGRPMYSHRLNNRRYDRDSDNRSYRQGYVDGAAERRRKEDAKINSALHLDNK
jgi:hypothetical protein